MVYGWIVLHKTKVTREIFENKNILSKALTGAGFEQATVFKELFKTIVISVKIAH